MTSAATIGLINSGMFNCPVSASDVRNKDAAKGVSVAGLMGKAKKHKSVSPGYALFGTPTSPKHQREIISPPTATILVFSTR